MEGVRIENLEESEKEIVLQISLERRTQICRCCGAETERVHDYRIRQVRDLELRGKLRAAAVSSSAVRLPCLREAIRRTEHICRSIHALHPPNRRENHDSAAPAQQHEGRRRRTQDVSISGVTARAEASAPVSKPSRLPEAVSFDEFKGNAGGERFQCIVTDPLQSPCFRHPAIANRGDDSGLPAPVS